LPLIAAKQPEQLPTYATVVASTYELDLSYGKSSTPIPCL
jgi:hypothetical protein